MKNKKFYIRFADAVFKNGTILKYSLVSPEIKVIKYCNSNWYRRLFTRIGFNMHIGQYKVKQL